MCGLSDEVLILYIWDIQVLPDYQDQGIERELLRGLLERFDDIYQVNAHPDGRYQDLLLELGLVSYADDQAPAMTRMRLEIQDGGTRAVRSL